VDEKSLRLLKAMREQLGEITGRAVDAGAAAKKVEGAPKGTCGAAVATDYRQGGASGRNWRPPIQEGGSAHVDTRLGSG
jgi:hypothetical protein